MKEGRINLFSDTQTRPTRAMLEAMCSAEVGDEQLGLDPTTNQLCETVARLLGKEAAVFMPSGTMCNQISMAIHCRPGDEIYAHESSHLIRFEGGGAAVLAGASIQPVGGARGKFRAETLSDALREDNRYEPRARAVIIEQTTNMGGGAIWPSQQIEAVAEVARSRNMRVHMDGARLLNAVVASGSSAEQICAPCDSAWIDLSKGLGCPVGAVLAGSKDFIGQAWRWKQRLGGALRQSGLLAAAGLHALEHHVQRLADDHANAQRFAEIVGGHPDIDTDPQAVETNIVFVDLTRIGIPARKVVDQLESQGINLSLFDDFLLRAVTHLGVDRTGVEQAAQALLKIVESNRQA